MDNLSQFSAVYQEVTRNAQEDDDASGRHGKNLGVKAALRVLSGEKLVVRISDRVSEVTHAALIDMQKKRFRDILAMQMPECKRTLREIVGQVLVNRQSTLKPLLSDYKNSLHPYILEMLVDHFSEEQIIILIELGVLQKLVELEKPENAFSQGSPFSLNANHAIEGDDDRGDSWVVRNMKEIARYWPAAKIAALTAQQLLSLNTSTRFIQVLGEKWDIEKIRAIAPYFSDCNRQMNAWEHGSSLEVIADWDLARIVATLPNFHRLRHLSLDAIKLLGTLSLEEINFIVPRLSAIHVATDIKTAHDIQTTLAIREII